MPRRPAGATGASEGDVRPGPSRPEEQEQATKQQQQQQPCFDFTKGRCARGRRCRFSHDVSAIMDFNSSERGICFDHLRGQCLRGVLCRFSHDLSIITQPCPEGSGSVPGAQQQQQPAAGARAPANAHAMCFDFVKGRCQRGSDCRYSHDLALIARVAGPGRMQGQVCQDHLRGRCVRGQYCRYIHLQHLPCDHTLGSIGHSSLRCSLTSWPSSSTDSSEGALHPSHPGAVHDHVLGLHNLNSKDFPEWEAQGNHAVLGDAFDLDQAGWWCGPEADAGLAAPELPSPFSEANHSLGQQQQGRGGEAGDGAQPGHLDRRRTAPGALSAEGMPPDAAGGPAAAPRAEQSGVWPAPQACLLQSISVPDAGLCPSPWAAEGSRGAGLLGPASPSSAPDTSGLHPGLLPLLRQIWNQ